MAEILPIQMPEPLKSSIHDVLQQIKATEWPFLRDYVAIRDIRECYDRATAMPLYEGHAWFLQERGPGPYIVEIERMTKRYFPNTDVHQDPVVHLNMKETCALADDPTLQAGTIVLSSPLVARTAGFYAADLFKQSGQNEVFTPDDSVLCGQEFLQAANGGVMQFDATAENHLLPPLPVETIRFFMSRTFALG